MIFLLPLIGLIAGIVAADYVNGPLWSALPILGALLVYLILLKKSAIPTRAMRLNNRHSVWIIMLFAGIGMITQWIHSPQEIQDNDVTRYIAIYGEVSDIRTASTGDVLVIDATQLYDKGGNATDCRNVKVTVKTDGYTANKGDLLFIPCSISPISDNGNYRSTGHVDRMRRKGILYSAYAESDCIKRQGHAGSLASSAYEWRDRTEIVLEKSSLNRETCEFIISILLGDRSFLDNEVRVTFNNAGVAHVLALSGMHVAIIMGIILFILYPLKAIGMHRTRYWLAVAIIWIFAYFTGFANSTIRACIMTTFLILAMSLQRKNASSNALLASAFVILLMQPSAIYDVGMQLSFLCVACVLAFAGPLNTVNQHLHPRLHSLNASILVSLVATLGTWVVVSYYFKRIPLLFLPVNFLMLPLLPIYLSLALIYTALCLCGIDLIFIAKMLDAGYGLFMTIAEKISAFGSATVEFQATLPMVVIWLVGVLVIGYAIRQRHKCAAWITEAGLFTASLAVIPLMTKEVNNCMIFQKKYSDISMALYDSDKETVTSFPRNAISRIRFKDNDIISLDCINHLDTIATMLMKDRSRKKYLILGSGFKNKKISDIPGLDGIEKIILHPSLRKKKENEFLQEALDSGINKLHSLRLDGPLEINL